MNTDLNERIRLLKDLVASEMKKEDPDIALVTESLALLRELDDSMVTLTSEELRLRCENFTATVGEKKEAETETETKSVAPFKKRLSFGKRLAIALSAVFLAVALLATVAVASSDRPYSEWLDIVFGMEPGSTETVDGFTYSRGEESKEYESLEELFRDQNLDLLFPAVLPEGARVRMVSYGKYGEEELYTIGFTDLRYGYIIRCQYQGKMDFASYGRECLTVNGYDFYWFSGADAVSGEIHYQANMVLEGTMYTIKAPTYEEMVIMITNMKEVSK